MLHPAGTRLRKEREDDPDPALVIAVGAVHDTIGQVAPFSGYGPWVTACAGGVDVVGPYFEDGYPKGYHGWAIWSGTSFSAATVTGRIAARMAADKSARAAWDELLTDPPAEIEVWDVNGPRTLPYIKGLGPA